MFFKLRCSSDGICVYLSRVHTKCRYAAPMMEACCWQIIHLVRGEGEVVRRLHPEIFEIVLWKWSSSVAPYIVGMNRWLDNLIVIYDKGSSIDAEENTIRHVYTTTSITLLLRFAYRCHLMRSWLVSFWQVPLSGLALMLVKCLNARYQTQHPRYPVM